MKKASFALFIASFPSHYHHLSKTISLLIVINFNYKENLELHPIVYNTSQLNKHLTNLLGISKLKEIDKISVKAIVLALSCFSCICDVDSSQALQVFPITLSNYFSTSYTKLRSTSISAEIVKYYQNVDILAITLNKSDNRIQRKSGNRVDSNQSFYKPAASVRFFLCEATSTWNQTKSLE